MCTVMIIQQMSTNCVLTNDDGLCILPHISLYLSLRHITLPLCFFLSLFFHSEFRFLDQEFVSKNLRKTSKNNCGAAHRPPPYGAALLLRWVLNVWL